MMYINKEGIELIKHFESLRLEAYQDSVGVWTIGWGHTKNVFKGMKITKEEAEEFLKKDLEVFENLVNDLLEVEINDNQFSALVSFSFNLGINNLKKSTLLKLINEKDFFNSSKEFVKWSNAGGRRLKGLVRRRLSERNLYCSFSSVICNEVPNNWENIYLDL